MTAARRELRNIPASVRQRLRNLAQERGEDARALLERFVAERFLYRLGQSPQKESFILRGAALLPLWSEHELRPTRDVDFLHRGPASPGAVRRAIEEVLAIECLEDGLHFDRASLRLEEILHAQEYPGLRVKLEGRLASSRIHLKIDIGHGDAVTPSAEAQSYPTLLGHPAPHLKTYPRETFIAEKFEAMVRFGLRTTRMRDFWDVAAVAGQLAFDGVVLSAAVAATFERRRTPVTTAVPDALAAAFYQNPDLLEHWRVFQQRVQPQGPAPSSFDAVGEVIMSFLTPVRASLVAGEPLQEVWRPGGPWRPAGDG